jgi:6-methylsalicylate decarboxylase
VHVDIHQHLWPAAMIEELRRRTQPPRLAGWTLITSGEPPFEVSPADHDLGKRAAQAARDGLDLALIGMSCPLGIEYLPPDHARPLLDAYHEDLRELGPPFGWWAAACLTAIDVQELVRQLDRGCAGLQLPATALADESGYRHCAPLLAVLEERDLPLLVHPGPAAAVNGGPGWWPAVVSYVQQMHAAWFAFRVHGRPSYPRLRVCFAALAGLAPLHGERMAARGGADALARGFVDPNVYVETSSYGSRAVDAVVRVLGADVVVLGSDRPYAEPADLGLGECFADVIRSANPARLLKGATSATSSDSTRREEQRR